MAEWLVPDNDLLVLRSLWFTHPIMLHGLLVRLHMLTALSAYMDLFDFTGDSSLKLMSAILPSSSVADVMIAVSMANRSYRKDLTR